jgi:hypothetical protein
MISDWEARKISSSLVSTAGGESGEMDSRAMVEKYMSATISSMRQ